MTAQDLVRGVLAGTVRYEAGLDALSVAPPAEVNAVLTKALYDACERLWQRGWQPIELQRVVARRGKPQHARLIIDAVAMERTRHRPESVDERWLAQADALNAVVWWDPAAPYLDGLAAADRSDRVTIVDAMLHTLGVLDDLPKIEMLIPPPGSAPARDRPGHGVPRVDLRHLDRVRALLAKAESSRYPAEAETYTAKAQELISRHSIDEALLAVRTGGVDVVPLARRIGVDHPYENEKVSQLDAIARANRCHVVWSPELAFATVFGFDADIDAVELLHTSLLLQAHRVMSQTEPPGGKAGRARLRSYRQSFLVAWAVRIGERLAGTAAAALAEASHGAGLRERSDLLPALASRDERVRESMRTVFPHTVRGRAARIDSDEGWDSGRAAADRAALPAPPPSSGR